MKTNECGLSERAFCIVKNSYGLPNFERDEENTIYIKQEMRKAIDNGYDLRRLRNCGPKTVNEIRNWCGLPAIENPSKWKFNPYTGTPIQ